MRPYNGYFAEFGELDNSGCDGIEAIRHLIDDMLRQDQQIASGKQRRFARRDNWRKENFGQHSDAGGSDYDDYDEDEFDRYSGIDIGHH